jgi:hypothetical protein
MMERRISRICQRRTGFPRVVLPVEAVHASRECQSEAASMTAPSTTPCRPHRCRRMRPRRAPTLSRADGERFDFDMIPSLKRFPDLNAGDDPAPGVVCGPSCSR